MRIGFDLDRILIDYPPIVPNWLIDWLYKDNQSSTLAYRFPTTGLEQFIRKISHIYLLRPKIQHNIEFINHFPSKASHELFLISSRYNFLASTTHKILARYKINGVFKGIFLNTQDQQPHLFKERLIKQLKLEVFIDDDLDLLKYLQPLCPNTKLLWYNPKGKKNHPNGITAIKDLGEVLDYLPNS